MESEGDFVFLGGVDCFDWSWVVAFLTKLDNISLNKKGDSKRRR